MVLDQPYYTSYFIDFIGAYIKHRVVGSKRHGWLHQAMVISNGVLMAYTHAAFFFLGRLSVDR